jgi:hypothetical protein
MIFNALRLRAFSTVSVALLLVSSASIASATDLRIVTWNIDADTGGAVGAMGGVDGGPGLITVLQAIGNEHLAGNAQPIDVLALEELNGTGANAVNAVNATLEYVVGQLNDIYGAGTYAYDKVTDTTDDPGDTGNGPSGLIYNTTTVQDISATPIGTVGSSGAARAPMLYHLAPVGNPSSDFYMYVEHAKSGTGTTNESRREAEATEVRASAATLGASAHIIYAGDFNTTTGSEAGYQTMVAAGIGQAHDVANPNNSWTDTSNYHAIMTESATNLQYRDDFQFVSGNVLTPSSGLGLVPNSYEAFGNNGSTAFHGAVNAAGNTALSDLSNQQTVLNDLTTATDHLPIVADYSIIVSTPEPDAFYLMAIAGVALLWVLVGKTLSARRSIV